MAGADPGFGLSRPLAETDRLSLELAKLKLPEEIGRIDEIFIPAEPLPDAPLIVYLQDAHTNLGAQENLAGIARKLSKTLSIDSILAEGGSGEADLSFLRSFPDRAVKEKATEFWMKEAVLTGLEREAILGPAEYRYFGIEEPAAYEEGGTYFVRARAAAQAFLAGLSIHEQRNLKMREKYFNPPLLRFTNLTAKFDSRNELIQLVSFLANEARNLHLNRWKYSEIEKFIDLILLEMSGGDPERFFQIQKTLDSKKLFEELEALKMEIRERLYRDEGEREIDQETRILAALGALAGLRAAPADYDFYLEHKESILDYAAKAKLDTGALEAAESFYRSARRRDELFFENVKTLLEGEKMKRALLVTGGFHAPGLTAQFRKNKIPFVLISPQISEEDNLKQYFERIEGKRADLKAFESHFRPTLPASTYAAPGSIFDPAERGTILASFNYLAGGVTSPVAAGRAELRTTGAEAWMQWALELRDTPFFDQYGPSSVAYSVVGLGVLGAAAVGSRVFRAYAKRKKDKFSRQGAPRSELRTTPEGAVQMETPEPDLIGVETGREEFLRLRREFDQKYEAFETAWEASREPLFRGLLNYFLPSFITGIVLAGLAASSGFSPAVATGLFMLGLSAGTARLIYEHRPYEIRLRQAKEELWNVTGQFGRLRHKYFKRSDIELVGQAYRISERWRHRFGGGMSDQVKKKFEREKNEFLKRYGEFKQAELPWLPEETGLFFDLKLLDHLERTKPDENEIGKLETRIANTGIRNLKMAVETDLERRKQSELRIEERRMTRRAFLAKAVAGCGAAGTAGCVQSFFRNRAGYQERLKTLNQKASEQRTEVWTQHTLQERIFDIIRRNRQDGAALSLINFVLELQAEADRGDKIIRITPQAISAFYSVSGTGMFPTAKLVEWTIQGNPGGPGRQRIVFDFGGGDRLVYEPEVVTGKRKEKLRITKELELTVNVPERSINFEEGALEVFVFDWAQIMNMKRNGDAIEIWTLAGPGEKKADALQLKPAFENDYQSWLLTQNGRSELRIREGFKIEFGQGDGFVFSAPDQKAGNGRIGLQGYAFEPKDEKNRHIYLRFSIEPESGNIDYSYFDPTLPDGYRLSTGGPYFPQTVKVNTERGRQTISLQRKHVLAGIRDLLAWAIEKAEETDNRRHIPKLKTLQAYIAEYLLNDPQLKPQDRFPYGPWFRPVRAHDAGPEAPGRSELRKPASAFSKRMRNVAAASTAAAAALGALYAIGGLEWYADIKSGIKPGETWFYWPAALADAVTGIIIWGTSDAVGQYLNQGRGVRWKQSLIVAAFGTLQGILTHLLLNIPDHLPDLTRYLSFDFVQGLFRTGVVLVGGFGISMMFARGTSLARRKLHVEGYEEKKEWRKTADVILSKLIFAPPKTYVVINLLPVSVRVFAEQAWDYLMTIFAAYLMNRSDSLFLQHISKLIPKHFQALFPERSPLIDEDMDQGGSDAPDGQMRSELRQSSSGGFPAAEAERRNVFRRILLKPIYQHKLNRDEVSRVKALLPKLKSAVSDTLSFDEPRDTVLQSSAILLAEPNNLEKTDFEQKPSSDKRVRRLPAANVERINPDNFSGRITDRIALSDGEMLEVVSITTLTVKSDRRHIERNVDFFVLSDGEEQQVVGYAISEFRGGEPGYATVAFHIFGGYRPRLREERKIREIYDKFLRMVNAKYEPKKFRVILIEGSSRRVDPETNIRFLIVRGYRPEENGEIVEEVDEYYSRYLNDEPISDTEIDMLRQKIKRERKGGYSWFSPDLDDLRRQNKSFAGRINETVTHGERLLSIAFPFFVTSTREGDLKLYSFLEDAPDAGLASVSLGQMPLNKLLSNYPDRRRGLLARVWLVGGDVRVFDRSLNDIHWKADDRLEESIKGDTSRSRWRKQHRLMAGFVDIASLVLPRLYPQPALSDIQERADAVAAWIRSKRRWNDYPLLEDYPRIQVALEKQEGAQARGTAQISKSKALAKFSLVPSGLDRQPSYVLALVEIDGADRDSEEARILRNVLFYATIATRIGFDDRTSRSGPAGGPGRGERAELRQISDELAQKLLVNPVFLSEEGAYTSQGQFAAIARFVSRLHFRQQTLFHGAQSIDGERLFGGRTVLLIPRDGFAFQDLGDGRILIGRQFLETLFNLGLDLMYRETPPPYYERRLPNETPTRVDLLFYLIAEGYPREQWLDLKDPVLAGVPRSHFRELVTEVDKGTLTLSPEEVEAVFEQSRDFRPARILPASGTAGPDLENFLRPASDSGKLMRDTKRRLSLELSGLVAEWRRKKETGKPIQYFSISKRRGTRFVISLHRKDLDSDENMELFYERTAHFIADYYRDAARRNDPLPYISWRHAVGLDYPPGDIGDEEKLQHIFQVWLDQSNAGDEYGERSELRGFELLGERMRRILEDAKSDAAETRETAAYRLGRIGREIYEAFQRIGHQEHQIGILNFNEAAELGELGDMTLQAYLYLADGIIQHAQAAEDRPGAPSGADNRFYLALRTIGPALEQAFDTLTKIFHTHYDVRVRRGALAALDQMILRGEDLIHWVGYVFSEGFTTDPHVLDAAMPLVFGILNAYGGMIQRTKLNAGRGVQIEVLNRIVNASEGASASAYLLDIARLNPNSLFPRNFRGAQRALGRLQMDLELESELDSAASHAGELLKGMGDVYRNQPDAPSWVLAQEAFEDVRSVAARREPGGLDSRSELRVSRGENSEDDILKFYTEARGHVRNYDGLLPGAVEQLTTPPLSDTPPSEEMFEQLREESGVPEKDFLLFKEAVEQTGSGIGAFLHLLLLVDAGFPAGRLSGNIKRIRGELGGYGPLKQLLENMQANPEIKGNLATLADLINLRKVHYIAFALGQDNGPVWFAVPPEIAKALSIAVPSIIADQKGPYWLLDYYYVDRQIKDDRIWKFEQVHEEAKERLALLMKQKAWRTNLDFFYQTVGHLVNAFGDLFEQSAVRTTDQFKNGESFLAAIRSKQLELRASIPSRPGALDAFNKKWTVLHRWTEEDIDEVQSFNDLIHFLHQYYVSHQDSIFFEQREIQTSEKILIDDLLRSHASSMLIDVDLQIVRQGSISDLRDYKRNFETGHSSYAFRQGAHFLPLLPIERFEGDRFHRRDVAPPDVSEFFTDQLRSSFNGNWFIGEIKSERAHYLSTRMHFRPFSNGGYITTTLLGGGDLGETGLEPIGDKARTSIPAEFGKRLMEIAGKRDPNSPFEFHRFLPVAAASIRNMVNLDAQMGILASEWKDMDEHLTLDEVRAIKGEKVHTSPDLGALLESIEAHVQERLRMFQAPEAVHVIRKQLNSFLFQLGLEGIPDNHQFINLVTFERSLVNPIVQGLKSGKLVLRDDGGVALNSNYDGRTTPIERMIRIAELTAEQNKPYAEIANILNQLEPRYSRLEHIAYIGRLRLSKISVELAASVWDFYALYDPDTNEIVLAYLDHDPKAAPETVRKTLEIYYPLTRKQAPPARLSLVDEMRKEVDKDAFAPITVHGTSFSPDPSQKVVGRLVTRIPEHAGKHHRFILLVDMITPEHVTLAYTDPRIVGFVQTKKGVANMNSHQNLALVRLKRLRVGLPPSVAVINQSDEKRSLDFENAKAGSYIASSRTQAYPVYSVDFERHRFNTDENYIITLDGNGTIEFIGNSHHFRGALLILNRIESGEEGLSLFWNIKIGELSEREIRFLFTRIIASQKLTFDQKNSLLAKLEIKKQLFQDYLAEAEAEARRRFDLVNLRIETSDFPREIVYLLQQINQQAKSLEDMYALMKILYSEADSHSVLADFKDEWEKLQAKARSRWDKLSGGTRKKLSVFAAAGRKKRRGAQKSDLPIFKRTLGIAERLGARFELPFYKRVQGAYGKALTQAERRFKNSIAAPLRAAFYLEDLVGGKARELGEVRAHQVSSKDPAAGRTVPGVSLTRVFYERFLSSRPAGVSVSIEDEIREVLARDGLSFDEKQEQIRSLISRVEWRDIDLTPEQVKRYENLLNALVQNARFEPLRFVVRSAQREEGTKVSPGTFETVLAVGPEHLFSAVKVVLASNWSGQALAERSSRGGEYTQGLFGEFMTPFVQPLIPAVVSGVVRAEGHEITINAGYGIAAVVDELADADFAEMRHSEDYERVKVGIKQKRKVINQAGEGLLVEEVSEEERRKPALDDGELTYLYQVAAYWQDLLSHPIALEFAKDGASGEIYVTDIKLLKMPWDDISYSQSRVQTPSKTKYPDIMISAPRRAELRGAAEKNAEPVDAVRSAAAQANAAEPSASRGGDTQDTFLKLTRAEWIQLLTDASGNLPSDVKPTIENLMFYYQLNQGGRAVPTILDARRAVDQLNIKPDEVRIVVSYRERKPMTADVPIEGFADGDLTPWTHSMIEKIHAENTAEKERMAQAVEASRLKRGRIKTRLQQAAIAFADVQSLQEARRIANERREEIEAVYEMIALAARRVRGARDVISNSDFDYRALDAEIDELDKIALIAKRLQILLPERKKAEKTPEETRGHLKRKGRLAAANAVRESDAQENHITWLYQHAHELEELKPDEARISDLRLLRHLYHVLARVHWLKTKPVQETVLVLAAWWLKRRGQKSRAAIIRHLILVMLATGNSRGIETLAELSGHLDDPMFKKAVQSILPEARIRRMKYLEPVQSSTADDLYPAGADDMRAPVHGEPVSEDARAGIHDRVHTHYKWHDVWDYLRKQSTKQRRLPPNFKKQLTQTLEQFVPAFKEGAASERPGGSVKRFEFKITDRRFPPQYLGIRDAERLKLYLFELNDDSSRRRQKHIRLIRFLDGSMSRGAEALEAVIFLRGAAAQLVVPEEKIEYQGIPADWFDMVQIPNGGVRLLVRYHGKLFLYDAASGRLIPQASAPYVLIPETLRPLVLEDQYRVPEPGNTGRFFRFDDGVRMSGGILAESGRNRKRARNQYVPFEEILENKKQIEAWVAQAKKKLKGNQAPTIDDVARAAGLAPEQLSRTLIRNDLHLSDVGIAPRTSSKPRAELRHLEQRQQNHLRALQESLEQAGDALTFIGDSLNELEAADGHEQRELANQILLEEVGKIVALGKRIGAYGYPYLESVGLGKILDDLRRETERLSSQVQKTQERILAEANQNQGSDRAPALAAWGSLWKTLEALSAFKKVLEPVGVREYLDAVGGEFLGPDRFRFRLSQELWKQPGGVWIPFKGKAAHLKFSRSQVGMTIVLERGRARSNDEVEVIRVYRDEAAPEQFLYAFVLTEHGYSRSDAGRFVTSDYTFQHPLFPDETFYVSTRRGLMPGAKDSLTRVVIDDQDRIVKITNGNGIPLRHFPVRDTYRGKRLGTMIGRSEHLHFRWPSFSGVIEGLPLLLTPPSERSRAAYIRVSDEENPEGRDIRIASAEMGGKTASVMFEGSKPVEALVNAEDGPRKLYLLLKRDETGAVVQVARLAFFDRIGDFTGSVLRFKADEYGRASLGAPLSGVKVADESDGETWMTAAFENGVITRSDEWDHVPPSAVYDFRELKHGEVRARLFARPRPAKTHLFTVLRDFQYRPLASYKSRISTAAYQAHEGMITGLRLTGARRTRVQLADSAYQLPSYYAGHPYAAHRFPKDKLILFVIYGMNGERVKDAYLYHLDGGEVREDEIGSREKELREQYGYTLDLDLIWRSKRKSEKAFRAGRQAFQAGEFDKAERFFKRVSRRTRALYPQAKQYLEQRIPHRLDKKGGKRAELRDKAMQTSGDLDYRNYPGVLRAELRSTVEDLTGRIKALNIYFTESVSSEGQHEGFRKLAAMSGELVDGFGKLAQAFSHSSRSAETRERVLENTFKMITALEKSISALYRVLQKVEPIYLNHSTELFSITSGVKGLFTKALDRVGRFQNKEVRQRLSPSLEEARRVANTASLIMKAIVSREKIQPASNVASSDSENARISAMRTQDSEQKPQTPSAERKVESFASLKSAIERMSVRDLPDIASVLWGLKDEIDRLGLRGRLEAAHAVVAHLHKAGETNRATFVDYLKYEAGATDLEVMAENFGRWKYVQALENLIQVAQALRDKPAQLKAEIELEKIKGSGSRNSNRSELRRGRRAEEPLKFVLGTTDRPIVVPGQQLGVEAYGTERLEDSKKRLGISFSALRKDAVLRGAFVKLLERYEHDESFEVSILAPEFGSGLEAEREVLRIFGGELKGRNIFLFGPVQLYARERLGIAYEADEKVAFNRFVDLKRQDVNAVGFTTRVVLVAGEQALEQLRRRDTPKLLAREEALEAVPLIFDLNDSTDYWRRISDDRGILVATRAVIDALQNRILERLSLGRAA